MQKIEHQFSEENYLLGELLFDKNAVQNPVRTKGNVWTYTISDQQLYQVTIKRYGTKRAQYDCECQAFLSEAQCPHIVSALLFLRKSLSDVKLRDKETKVRSLNIGNILNTISHEELIRYTKLAAKHDRSFNAMLKAVFAHRVNMEDNAKKYEQIIQPYVQPNRKVSKAKVDSDTRLAMRIIREFYDQLEDAASLERHTEVYDLTRGILSKMHYLYFQYDPLKTELARMITALHSHISNMYKAALAPDFLQRLDAEIIRLVGLSYYNFIDLQNDPILILYRNNRKEILKIAIKLVLDKKFKNLDQKSISLALALIQLTHYDDLLDKTAEITDQDLIESAQILRSWELPQKAIKLLRDLNYEQIRNRTLEYALIDMYYLCNQFEEADFLVLELLVNHKETRLLRRLKKAYNQHVPDAIKEKIIKKLQTNIDYRFKAQLFREFKEVSLLIETIEASQDLQLLMEHDVYLYKEDYVKLEFIYETMVAVYLKKHVGQQPLVFINEIFHHLEMNGMFKISKVLKKMMDAKYPDRNNFDFFK